MQYKHFECPKTLKFVIFSQKSEITEVNVKLQVFLGIVRTQCLERSKRNDMMKITRDHYIHTICIMPNTSHWVEFHGQIFTYIPKPPPKDMVFLARIGFSAPRDTMVVLLSRNTYNVVVNYFTIYTPMKSSVDVEYRPSNHPKMTF